MRRGGISRARVAYDLLQDNPNRSFWTTVNQGSRILRVARRPWSACLVADLPARSNRAGARASDLKTALIAGQSHHDLWWLPEVIRMRAAMTKPWLPSRARTQLRRCVGLRKCGPGPALRVRPAKRAGLPGAFRRCLMRTHPNERCANAAGPNVVLNIMHFRGTRMTTTSADIPTGAGEQLAATPRGMEVCSGQVCPRCRQPAYVSGVSWLGRSWTECLACGDAWTVRRRIGMKKVARVWAPGRPYARLVAVKDRHDPGNLLRLRHRIRPRGRMDRA